MTFLWIHEISFFDSGQGTCHLLYKYLGLKPTRIQLFSLVIYYYLCRGINLIDPICSLIALAFILHQIPLEELKISFTSPIFRCSNDNYNRFLCYILHRGPSYCPNVERDYSYRVP